MRFYVKIIAIIAVFIGLNACKNKSPTVFLEKDGKLYEVADQVSFYYPKEYTIDTAADNKAVVRFVNDQEVMTYTTVSDDTDNKVEDMPELYAGQLEEDGATEVAYKNLKINSGLTCQEFTGMFKATGMKFKHMVYFTSDASYILTYQAPQVTYDENISVISEFLGSLTVHHELST